MHTGSVDAADTTVTVNRKQESEEGYISDRLVVRITKGGQLNFISGCFTFFPLYYVFATS